MKILKQLITLFMWLWIASVSQIVFADELPSDSVYQLTDTWKTQDNTDFQLKDLQGKKQVVTMIYTNCPHTCPLITKTLQEVDASLSAKEKQEIGFVLVTFTPKLDTPKVLKKYAEKWKMGNNWVLLNGNDDSIRNLAMILDIKYQVATDGYVSHSNLVSILDKDGRLLKQENGINGTKAILKVLK